MIIEYYGDFAIHEQWYTCARFRFFVKEWIKWTSQVHLHYLLKSRLQRAGLDIVVKKLSGCNSSEHKEKVMSDFRLG